MESHKKEMGGIKRTDVYKRLVRAAEKDLGEIKPNLDKQDRKSMATAIADGIELSALMIRDRVGAKPSLRG